VVSTGALAPVVVATCSDAAAWDAFVQQQPDASGYHLWGWKAIFEGVFGHRTEYLAARRDGRLVGVLPLVLFESAIFGRFVVSLPFVNYGGVVADDDQAAAALVARAGEITRPRASHLELRRSAPFPAPAEEWR
jgi:hypothetical protein